MATSLAPLPALTYPANDPNTLGWTNAALGQPYVGADGSHWKYAGGGIWTRTDQAAAAINYRGPHSMVTAYATGDAVSTGNKLWIANRANTGVAPVEGLDWSGISTQGPQGIQGNPGPSGPFDASVLTTGVLDRARMGTGGAVDDVLSLDGSLNPVWKQTGAAIVGQVDPLDYGYVATRPELPVQFGVDNWGALSAAAYECYAAEYEGTVTGAGSTALVNDANAAFDGTFWFVYQLDDRIDVGASPDFAFEIVWITGDNRGEHCFIDVVNSATQVAVTPALPNPTAAGDRFRVLRCRRTQSRRWEKVLRIPAGRGRIAREFDAICSVISPVVDGYGLGISVIQPTTHGLTPRQFDGATATTLVRKASDPAWTVDEFKGKWVWTWAGLTGTAGMSPVERYTRILSNDADEIVVDGWFGATPDHTASVFAVGERSGIFLNGVTHGTFSNFTLDNNGSPFSNADPMIFGLLVNWLRPGFAPEYLDLAALSSSQNTFLRVQVYGKYAKQNLRYGNFIYAVNNQVDNGVFIAIHAVGAWEPGASTDQRWTESVVAVGDGTGANAVINNFYGCTFFYGQYGAMVNACDAAFMGCIFQSCGDRARLGAAGRGLGNVYVQLVSNYVGLYFCRSELSSRMLTCSPTTIHQQLEIVQCTFYIDGDYVFADDGNVIDSELPGTISIRHFWVLNFDPMTFATPRTAKFRTYGSVDMVNVGIVGSTLEEGLGTCAILPGTKVHFNGPYHDVGPDNVPDQTWHRGLVTVSASRVAYGIDEEVYLDGATAAVDYTLPASRGTGREIVVDCINAANTVRVLPAGTDEINGSAAAVVFALNDSHVFVDRAVGEWRMR